MSLLVTTTAATVSAITYATAGVLQHRAARQAAPGRGLQLGLMARLLARPLWLAGIALDVVGLALHAVALSSGSLVIVQPLLVSGLLFALPASAVLEHRRHSRAEWGWAAVLVAALAAFLVASSPTAGHVPSDSDRLAAFTLCGSAACALVVVVASRSSRYRAALLGAVAGIAYGMTAALMKAAIGIGTGPHPAALLTTWPLYLLVAVGGTALVVNQVAYQAGPLAASLPPITILDPVVAIILGVAVFDERLSTGAFAVVLEVLTFAVMAVATVELARRSPADPVAQGPHPAGPVPQSPHPAGPVPREPRSPDPSPPSPAGSA